MNGSLTRRVAIDQFEDAIRSSGLAPPAISESGKVYRFSTNGKPSNDAGWCLLFDDYQGGVFGDHRSGLYETWQAKRDKPFTEPERQAFKQRCAQVKQESQAKREQQHADVRSRAECIWREAAPETGEHRYLRDKGVEPHGIRSDGQRLLIAMRDTDGTLRSLQFINPNGNKLYLKGGLVKGCYYPIGKLNDVLCVAEGFATGASVHEATGYAVAVAFDAGNLAPVVRALRAKYPDLRIVMCADDDCRTEGNPGVTAATAAARAVNGLIAVPDFDGERPDGATDFNDLAQHCGLDAVKRTIAKAKPPPTDQDQSANRAPTDSARLIFTSLGDLLAEPDEEAPWLVDDLLPQAGLSIITARPKSGKSTLARTLTLAVSRGARFLDRRTNAGTVFYLALEEKRAELRRQFRAMGATDEPIQFYCATAPADGVALLSDAVMRDKPALVIIDSLIRMARMVDSNSYSEASRALEPFIALARESGAHVMLVHHTGRGDRQGVDAPMGSTAFAGSVDTILVMRRTDRMRTLSSVQRYGTDLDEVVLTMDDTGRISTGGTKREHDEGEACERIKAYLSENPGVDQWAIRENVEGRWIIAQSALLGMVKAGTVVRKGAGKKGNPYLYSLASENSSFLVPTIYRELENQNPESDLSDCNKDSYYSSRDSAMSDTSGNQKNEAGNQHFEAESEVATDDDATMFDVEEF